MRPTRMNTLQQLHAEQDQSPWIDFIDRDLIESGKLEKLVAKGIRGLTSNPTIFGKAVASGQYDDLIRRQLEAGTKRADLRGDRGRDIQRRVRPPATVYDDAEEPDGFARSRSSRPGGRHRGGRWRRAASCGRASATERLRQDPRHPAGIPAVERRSPRASTST